MRLVLRVELMLHAELSGVTINHPARTAPAVSASMVTATRRAVTVASAFVDTKWPFMR